MTPEQVIVSLCKLKPDAKSLNLYSVPVMNSRLQQTGTTAKKFRSIINNHLSRNNQSEVESEKSSDDVIYEEDEHRIKSGA